VGQAGSRRHCGSFGRGGHEIKIMMVVVVVVVVDMVVIQGSYASLKVLEST